MKFLGVLPFLLRAKFPPITWCLENRGGAGTYHRHGARNLRSFFCFKTPVEPHSLQCLDADAQMGFQEQRPGVSSSWTMSPATQPLTTTLSVHLCTDILGGSLVFTDRVLEYR